MTNLIREFQTISSDRKDLRNFGLTVGGALFIIFLIWRGENFAIYLAMAGSLLIILGLTLPQLLKPLQKLWMGLAIILGFIVSHLILFLLYFLVFTPLGVVGRIIGKQFIQINYKKGTYWEKRANQEAGSSSYEKQY